MIGDCYQMHYLKAMIIGALISGVLAVIGLRLVVGIALLGASIAIFFPPALTLVYLSLATPVVGPILVLIWAKRSGNKGAAHGAVAAPVLLSAVSFVAASAGNNRMDQFLEQSIAAPKSDAEIIVLEDPRDCNRMECMEVVLETRYSVITKPRGDRVWQIHRSGSGADCYREENVSSTLSLLRRKFGGRCIIATPVQQIGDALIFRKKVGPFPEMPVTRESTRYELWERIAGEERLLGLGLRGRPDTFLHTVPLLFSQEHLPARELGSPQAVMNAALATNLNSRIDTLQQSTPIELLRFLKPLVFISSHEVRRNAIREFKSISSRRELRDSASLEKLRGEIRADLLPMLRSDDPDGVVTALSAIGLLGPEARAGLRGDLVLLALDHNLIAERRDGIRDLQVLLSESSEPFSADLRQSAKALLSETKKPSAERADLALVLLLAGGPAQRSDAFEYLFQLPSPRHEEFLFSVRGQFRTWSDVEITALLSRTRTVEINYLSDYLRAFANQPAAKARAKELIAVLKERLQAATDPNEVEILQRLIDHRPPKS